MQLVHVHRTAPGWFGTLLVVCAALSLPRIVQAQDRGVPMHIVYPEGAFTDGGALADNTGGFIINITLAPYNAVGDGTTDNTAAFKMVLTDLRDLLLANRKHFFSIYVPSGTYLVSDRLMVDESVPNGYSHVRLIGEDRRNTIIKLKDNCPGYGAGARKEVVACYRREDDHVGGLMWGNQLRNITVNTGSGNPGAIGVVWFGANAFSIDNLTVRSDDGQGWCGLFLPSWSQQGHISDVSVLGFDQGIRTQHVAETNPVFEYITLENQNEVGLSVDRSAPSIRKLKSVNTVEALRITGDGAHCVMVDCSLLGGGAGKAAIVLTDSSRQQLFVRNTIVSGYSSSINAGSGTAVTGTIDEWLSGQVFRVDESTPARSMNLPIEDAPLVPWESNPANWANPDDYPGANDAAKIQAALNSGKPAIYFPRYFFTAENTVLSVPATVRQIDLMRSDSWIWGGFRVTEPSATPLFVEHSTRKVSFRIAAARTLVARYGSMKYEVETTQPVVAHLQNIAVLQLACRDNFCPPNATIYARNINEESWDHTNFMVNGGILWVLGFKTESHQTAFH